MIVETNNASISTMSVTIQALHVNGKQMTLSVFRQLPEQGFHDVASHGGPIWGVVRYGVDGRDLWLVVQHKGSLCRVAADRVYRPEYARLAHDTEVAWRFARDHGGRCRWRDRDWDEMEVFHELALARARLAFLDQAAEAPQLFIAV